MDPENPLPGYRPEPRHTLGGKLKNIYIWRAPDDTLVLREVQQEQAQTEEVMAFNCAQWGYDPKEMSVRSTEERVAFGEQAFQAGLRVLQPTLLSDGSVQFPYLEGANVYSEFLRSADQADGEKKIHELFSDIEAAHGKDIVYGDRWPDNILIDPVRGVVHIDFDLKYGVDGKELEIAQLILYTLALGSTDAQSKSRYLDVVANELAASSIAYKSERVLHFLKTRTQMAPHYAHLAPLIEELRSRLGWS